MQAKNKDGRTAIDLARKTNNRHILDFLKENFDKLTFTTQWKFNYFPIELFIKTY